MAPVRGFPGFHHLGFLKDFVVNCMISHRCSKANWLEFKPVSKLVNCDLLLLLGSSKFRSAAFVSIFWVYCWASSNAEVWFSVSSCLLGTVLEHLQMQKAWFLFPAIFFVWSLSLFKCGSTVFVFSYLLGMVVELLQMRKYGFCFLPSFWVWILSSTESNYDFCFQLWFW